MAHFLPKTVFTQLDTDLHRLQHEHIYDQRKVGIDVIATAWFCMVVSPTHNQLQLYHNGLWVPINGPTAIFWPPFGIIKYQLNSGHLQWIGYGSERASAVLPKVTGYFSWSAETKIQSYSDMLYHLKLLQKDFTMIDSRHRHSAIAQKAKAYISHHFRHPISIKGVAKDLQVPYSTMTQDFKRCFGLSPSEYLKRIRVMYALHMMKVKSLSVTDSCFEAGFSDVSRFGQHFKSTFGRSPSRYDEASI